MKKKLLLTKLEIIFEFRKTDFTKPYSIGEVCRQANITKKKLFYFQRKGLFPPPYVYPTKSTEAGYPKCLVVLLKKIKKLQGQGYKLEEIKRHLHYSTVFLFHNYYVAKLSNLDDKLIEMQFIKNTLNKKALSPQEEIVFSKLVGWHLSRYYEQFKQEYKKPKVNPSLLGSSAQRKAFLDKVDLTVKERLRTAIVEEIVRTISEERCIRELVKRYGGEKVFQNLDSVINKIIKIKLLRT
jgi:DNA-binding transcriptional MerR regulator